MKKLILPLLLLSVCLCVCSVNESTVIERVQDLEGTQDMILQRVEALETTQPDLPPVEQEEQLTHAELCIWIQNISVSMWQAKTLFECIGSWQWYCNCIEEYATCDVRLSDIPQEYRDDFHPRCAN